MSAETPLLLPTPNSVPRVRQRRRGHLDCQDVFRLVLSASVVAAFLLFVLTISIINETTHRLPWNKQPDVVFPNFSHYKYIHTLPHSLFPTHSDDDRRIIAIGDIHSMNQSLSALLAEISYDAHSDTLIHLGDVVSKNTKLSTDPLLTFLSTNQILGVRGNNDQKVIEWRAWMDWIISLPGGKEWLQDMDSLWSHIDGDEPSTAFNTWLKKSHKAWQAYVPDGWKLQGNHYKVARDMSLKHYDYLRSLPLVLYAPTAHTFFVHAGLLAADPTLEASDPRQPLSHLPTTANPNDDDLILRGLQELALLNEIIQNQDPWVLMNMRSLSKKGKVKDGKNGIPWSDLWNDMMDSCSDSPATELSMNPSSSTTRTSLKCFPSMVMYGHAAARGLDVKRWSIGLDTGCAYGRRLTAVVLDAKSLLPQTHSEALGTSFQDSLVPYGDGGTAQLVNVKCHS
ncbi:Metallo-dependent phosphatase-like protein [Boletus edulis BED1]|uniref:Metallo-dependent phosphatase-like protein n=1 Tax=Boletus edulis BED1 TaxID=1328754 RepID=A0AAD4BXV0_BOLED|nr:Metallo-dependent phosphatase-like protein [Boletus edulis BED1]